MYRKEKPFKSLNKIMKKDVTIEAFMSLAQTLNYSETANEMEISQQAVSKNILRLEEKVGVPLFYRNSHKVALTEWGEKCYQIYETFFTELDTLKTAYETGNNSIRITTLEADEFDIVKNLKNFVVEKNGQEMKLFVDILDPYSATQALLNGKTDMIVTLSKFLDENNEVTIFPINQAEVCFLLSKKHPLYKQELTANDLKGETVIAAAAMEVFFGKYGHSIEKDIREFELNPKKIEIATTLEQAEKNAVSGKGIIVGTRLLAKKYGNDMAAIPSGVVTEVVCVWKRDNKKNLETVAKHIKKLYDKKFKGQII